MSEDVQGGASTNIGCPVMTLDIKTSWQPWIEETFCFVLLSGVCECIHNYIEIVCKEWEKFSIN